METQDIDRETEAKSTTPSCYHCGEVCAPDLVEYDQKNFCCQGCKTVYQILSENDLGAYYDLSQKPGITKNATKSSTYEFLDDPNVLERLVDFSDGQQVRTHFFLPQIHCTACLWLLEHLSRLNHGIVRSKVNFLRKEVYIEYQAEETSLRQVVELLDSIGYPPIINADRLEKKKHTSIDRSFYTKLATAGFAFGNIMLLSFPEYLGLDAVAESQFARFFGYLNLLLAVPVIFYAAQDYWQSAWQGLRQGMLNIDVPVTLGMLALFGRSAYEVLWHTGAGYFDSLAGLVFFLLVGKWYQKKTFYQISFDRDYKSYFPIAAHRIVDDTESAVALDQLQPGDLIRVRHQELIPTDGILTTGDARIDYAFVTGESRPVRVDLGEKIFAGGKQMGAGIEVQVTKRASNSYLTQLWNDEAFTKSDSSPRVSSIADTVAKYFTIVILTVAAATLLYWLPRDSTIAFQSFAAVLIVACPCAVALSIPFTLGNVLRILARQGFYLKNTRVIEALKHITDIVFDKTGTITKDNGQISFVGKSLSREDMIAVKSLVAQSSHPLSVAIHHLHQGLPTSAVSGFEESTGQGIQGSVQGREVKVGSVAFIDPPQVDELDAMQTSAHISVGGSYRGHYQYPTSFRPHLDQVIRNLKENHHLHLLTGDQDHQHESLKSIFPEDASLNYQQDPQAKLQYVKGLQEKNDIVLMLGDGLNDAGALKQSDVGIVITENTNNFTPASDAILDSSKFSYLPQYLKYSSGAITIVFFSYLLAVVYNAIGLAFAVQGLLSPVIAAILMPASSITVVLFGIGASSWLARRYGIWGLR